ncbi:MAG: NUDIX domain-containing protein [Saprospiraceae bacterium]
MENQNDLLEIYKLYIYSNPDEETRQNQFNDFIENTKFESLYDRKNFVGHITASAIIIDYTNANILLLHHRSLDRWLQPGGHVDYTDTSILAAALRETSEETGLNESDLELISPSFTQNIPFDIDSHFIPENKNKNEAQHYHHDFRFLFIIKGSKSIAIKNEEALNFKWVKFEELSRDTTFSSLVEKIRHLLSFEYRTKLFYESIISNLKNYDSEFVSIVVSHIIPDSVYYLRALNKIFPIIAVIPKPNSIDKEIYEITKSHFKISHISRNEMPNPSNDVIELILSTDKKILIFDIGGYFSKIHEGWPKEIIERIELIIEDTENGHQKYENSNIREKIKIVSVARSPIKENEDFLVGQSVLFSADAILRNGGTLIQYMKCGVLGYGKIGNSIAFHLLQRGIKPNVYDVNPLKRVKSFNELCSIPKREIIINSCDVIFSATGNKSLNIEDFRSLKNGCFVFSVTSSDDEMQLGFLEGEYKKEIVREYIVKYYNARNFFFLVNNGNAVNFIHNAIMANFIHLVRSEMLLSILELGNYKLEIINEVSMSLKKNICEKWIEKFDPENRNLSNIQYIL